MTTESTKINQEGFLLFEQPLTKVPYEQFRKVFRTSQRHVEREFNAVQSSISDLSKRPAEEINAAETAKSIDSMIARIEGLKRKLTDIHTNSTVPTQVALRQRIQHIAALETMTGTDDPNLDPWSNTRLNRWLVDWALRNDREETAKQLAEASGIGNLVDIELFSEIRRIEEALRKHSCTDALAWCSENKVALRKFKNTLEFELRLQEFIELARAGRELDAIAYSRRHLVSWYDTHLREITQAMALLACKPTTTKSASYKRLYDPSRWTTLIQSFRNASYTLNTLPTEPLLHLALYAGLASLKLPVCYDAASKNIDCPVCDSQGLGQLANEVPWSHHVNSTIVCRFSGRIMDADNPPMCFPNGYVYSQEALEEMAAKNDGTVTCPRSGQSCDFSELRKVFIM